MSDYPGRNDANSMLEADTALSLTNYPAVAVGRSYKYYPTVPSLDPALWEFGFGLSYTNFSLACKVQPFDFVIHSHTDPLPHHTQAANTMMPVVNHGESDPLQIHCTVTNEGPMVGAEAIVRFIAVTTCHLLYPHVPRTGDSALPRAGCSDGGRGVGWACVHVAG